MEDKIKKLREKKLKTTSKKTKKMEDDLKHNFKKSTLIGRDIIVN